MQRAGENAVTVEAMILRTFEAPLAVFANGNALAATPAFEDLEGFTSFPTFVGNLSVPPGGHQ
jgi:hypothetical protein